MGGLAGPPCQLLDAQAFSQIFVDEVAQPSRLPVTVRSRLFWFLQRRRSVAILAVKVEPEDRAQALAEHPGQV